MSYSQHNPPLTRPALAVCCAALVGWLVLPGCTKFGTSVERPLPTSAQNEVGHDGNIDAEAWSAWRGGNAHGVSPSQDLPLVFSAGTNVRWMTAVPGHGNSSPIVVGDHVYLTAAVGEGHRTQLAIIAFDRETGSQVWLEQVGRPIGATHQRNGHASATMASDGEHVVASFGAKGLFCYSTDGQRLWHRPYPGAVHEWGAAASPTIAGDMVIHLVESPSESFLAAYDLIDGRERWRTDRQSDGSWTSPVVADIGGRWQVVVNGSGSTDGSGGTISGYALANGRLLWEIAGTSDIVCPTAIVGDGVIISTSGSNGPILAMDTRSATPTSRWDLPAGGAYVPTGVAYRERVYLIDDDGLLRCLNAKDGNEIWKERLGMPVSASLVAGAGRIYVTGESGEVCVVTASDQFELLARNSLGERLLATPAIAGGDLFIRGESHLYCIAQKQPPLPSAEADEDPAAVGTAVISPSDVPVETPAEVPAAPNS